MNEPNWSELALRGLKRALPKERVDGAIKSINLRLALRSAVLVPLGSGLGKENMYMFHLFAGSDLRIVVENGTPPTIWAVGLQKVELTE
jgi:hypothetical protein